MRRILVCVLVAFCGQVALCQAQTAKIQGEVEKKLDQERTKQKALQELIAEAMKNNPDIRVGESKLRDAEADLQRTRMKVLSEVAVVHAELESAQAVANEAARNFERTKKMSGNALISSEDLGTAENNYLKSKANLAVIQAKLTYLLGKSSVQFTPAGSLKELLTGQRDLFRLAQLEYAKELEKNKVAGKPTSDEDFLRRRMLDLLGRTPTVEEMREYLKTPAQDRRQKWVEKMEQLVHEQIRGELLHSFGNIADSPMTDKVRKALDTPVHMDFGTVAPKDVLDHIHDAWLRDFNLLVRPKALKSSSLDMHLKAPVPLGALLQYLEDELQVVFVLRDYGIVVVTAEERLPPGAIRVVDLWKRGKATEKPAQSNPK